MSRLTVAALAVLALFASACSSGPTEAECTRLLEHTVEMEQTAAGLAPDAPTRGEEKQVLLEATRESFMDTCLSDLPAARVRCALTAGTKADMLACDDR